MRECGQMATRPGSGRTATAWRSTRTATRLRCSKVMRRSGRTATAADLLNRSGRTATAAIVLASAIACVCSPRREVWFVEDPMVRYYEIDPTDVPLRQVQYETLPAGRAISCLTEGMRRHNWLAAAEARRRAVELADGEGVLAPLPQWWDGVESTPGDSDECWDGSFVDQHEVRAHPLLWDGDSVPIPFLGV